jgi:hypothetical protein
LGQYNLSEILYRLDCNWGKQPWDLCGDLSLQTNNLLILLLGIFRMFVFDAEVYK